jgi:osmotically-inducible protein OsmY
MNSRITSFGLPAAVLAASLFAACQNTARGVEQDTEKNTAAVKEEAREAGSTAERKADQAADATKNAADRAADATKEAARDVERETKEAANKVGSTLDAAGQTMQIKTALIDADNVDAGGIDVDTNGSTKTVTLKGHVPTAAQKAEAERIAKAKAPDYRVVNELVVRP